MGEFIVNPDAQVCPSIRPSLHHLYVCEAVLLHNAGVFRSIAGEHTCVSSWETTATISGRPLLLQPRSPHTPTGVQHRLAFMIEACIATVTPPSPTPFPCKA
ncbi:unnamed protein product [Gadus morhua 'NCC']